MTSFVIMIDDEPDLCDLVKTILRKESLKVEAFQSGEKALSTIEGKNPDLVLLDIKMPGLDGWSVLREMNTRNIINETPVAMLTGEKLTLSKILRKDLDCLVDYIEKPFKPNELRKTVREILGRTKKIYDLKKKIEEKSQTHSEAMACAFVVWSRTQMIHETLVEKLKQIKTRCYNTRKRVKIENLMEEGKKEIGRSKTKKEEILELAGINKPLVTA